jgi:uncharacterized membrane protein
MSVIHKNRIESIDVLRGIVMIIMALDHVREFFHAGAFTGDPLDLATTTPILFFTRWITHFCAPIFVFLSGTSIYLQSLRKTPQELSAFLLKRGLWLILVELVIMTFALTLNPLYNVLILQVIWCIGITMVIMSGLIRLPFKVILAIGLVIVLGHNLLDIPESVKGFQANFWWMLVHRSGAYPIPTGRALLILYPFVPWTGLMLLGYCTGVYFSPKYGVGERGKILTRIGLGCLLLLVVLRSLNIYGDAAHWSIQKNFIFSVLSFLNLSKYPPSLLYLCMTIGPAFLMLAWLERLNNGITGVLRTYGRTAFFYYILHFYLIHISSAICFFARGHSLQDAIDYATKNQFPFLFAIPGEGVNLGIVYLIWIAAVASLYPLCRWYDRYKTGHPEKWWLSYL